MAYFDEFPHARDYDKDLGWLIHYTGVNIENIKDLQTWAAEHKEQYKDLADKVDGLINNLVDVIEPWDSSIAYHIFSIVEYQGTNYIAVQDVPVGAMITNTDYWQPANTVVEQINAIGATVDEVKDELEEITEGSEVFIHETEENGDTSYILLKLKKDKYEMEFHNCGGSDAAGPMTAITDPLTYLKNHMQYDVVTNCNYMGDFPGRLAGIEVTVASYTTLRLFCYNSTTGDIFVSSVGAALDTIPQSYDVVFPIDVPLVVNGVMEDIPDSGDYEPRNCFGWNDDEYIILITEGRGNHERGMRRRRCAEIMYNAGATNAYNFDGGGSVCMAVNYNGTAIKVNKYRDTGLPMPQLRARSLAQCYRRV